MKYKTPAKLLLLILCFSSITMSSQEVDVESRADQLFSRYSYAEAIGEYLRESKMGPLEDYQILNLADAYFFTGQFKKANEQYRLVYGNDGALNAQQLNRMLQAFSKFGGKDSIQNFLDNARSTDLSKALENAALNRKIISEGGTSGIKFEIFNLAVNSPQSDFAPFFFNELLLYTSAKGYGRKPLYDQSGEYYMDIFISKILNNGGLAGSTPFNGLPELKFHKATPFYEPKDRSFLYILSNTEDGKMLFDESGRNSLAIGQVDSTGTFKYAIRDLSTSFYYPYLDKASGKLYFAARLEGGYGGTDLYYVYTNNGLIMSAPVNLGPRINSPGNEIAPFIFENSLYFSSDVFYGFGGMDVYIAQMQDNDNFSIPVNLGSEINTEYDEFGFIIRNYGEEGLMGYFASNRPGGKGKDDLYGFRVAEKPGIKTFALKGRIVNEVTGVVVPEAQIKVLDSNGDILKELYAAENGTYQFEIPWEAGIILEASKEKHSTYRVAFDEEQMETMQESLFDIPIAFIEDLVEEKEGQTVIKLNKVYFDRGRSQITPQVAGELDRVVDVIKKFPELQLRIESHTDSRGGSATNFRISQSRADAIKAYLTSKGVPESNILYTIGYGEDKILNDCTNGVYCLETFHKQNERQLIVVLNYNILY
ncbi:OmpA family protein [Lentiprolixibacter aurantiacus]|uniref:OmpA family protein n=1 Tax=Lentiprolixibacter aurantiacus TaxID=2993939 RepID=A0AAE3MJS0_9FLAO|nr:OmpA family protein [Lentiprolixibacter aurantiacus]MCX2719065.1 OmpA family protein [Lentiprolixibacter aurantiacus]